MNKEKLMIGIDYTIKDALLAIDKGAKKIVFIIDNNNKLIGALTDGDIRRWILKDGDLNENVRLVFNHNPKYLLKGYSDLEAKNMFSRNSIDIIPIVDNSHQIIQIIEWEDIFSEEQKDISKKIALPVVIMAGGKGTRLDPFTRILPKPLIPIGNRAMIEIIMDEYAKFGMKRFYISINHKGKMIKAYFEDHESDYHFDYITENKPLGTAGALKYLEGKIDSPFFVSNCDIIIKDDYTNIYDFHKNNNYDLTIVASMQHHTIPYGVCEIENGGDLKSIKEKPQYNFLVNTGMYLLNPEILTMIPKNEFYHITYLMETMKTEGFKVGVYPVSESAYIDVGQWEEYQNAIKKLV